MREEESYSYKTPSSQLVEVAKIASRYRGKPEMLMKVIIQAQKVVTAFSASVAAVIAREMEIPQTQVYSFITFYAMLSVKPRGKYIIRMCKSAGRGGDCPGAGGTVADSDGGDHRGQAVHSGVLSLPGNLRGVPGDHDQ